MRYICAVQKYGSISQAAKELFISQPTLSVAIKDLEEELNVKLLERNRKGIRFTEAGNVVVESASRILTMVDALTTQIRNMSGDAREIRVGVSPAMTKQLVPMLVQQIDAFEASHPRCTVRLMERVYNRQFDDIDKGITTMAFGKGLQAPDSRLAYTPLWQSEVKLCVGKSHPLAQRKAVGIEDFIHEEILTFLNLDSKTNIAIMDWVKRQGYEINFHYFSQSGVVEELIRVGRGVALLIPKIYINNSEIVTVSIRDAVRLEYGVFYKKGRRLGSEELDFIDLVKKVLNE